MKPFAEALIDAILEEYAEIPCTTQNGRHQSANQKSAQVQALEDHGIGSPAAELERTSLWLDREEKYIYLHPTPGATQYFFLNQASKDMCLQTLIRRGYTLQD